MALLGDDGVRAALTELPAWSGDADRLERSVEAPDFLTGIRVVDDVAQVAESMDHHPDIDIRWRTVKFTLSTHSEGGVTAKDVELAHSIDDVAERHAPVS
ncbi:MAG TPA: 4a-hydroxytetrahydrobiopterin dehydratase [Jiangellaceae bacterium]|jgi:4a-hydroxytetrahydrobiopterin dehydratase